jgi:hypothetical protein
MTSTSKVLSLFIEVLFVLLGSLLVLLALSGRYSVPGRTGVWIGAAVLFWGIRSAVRPARGAPRGLAISRAASLFLAGLFVIAATWFSFRYFPTLLCATGVVLALRGMAGVVYFALSLAARAS